MYNDYFLQDKLIQRKQQNAFRTLRLPDAKIDFCSNDYLGIASIGNFHNINDLGINQRDNSLGSFNQDKILFTGSAGSRLLAGNYSLIEETERQIARFHDAESGLIFNSGYDANIGLLSCVPQKGDTIIYDFLSHASIRDGIRLSLAQSFAFLHNDLNDLERRLKHSTGTIFVVTETVFSMDGDYCPLGEIINLCKKYNAHLILDEAHATGVVGEKGEGLAQHLNYHKEVFARVHTFGKACGCHGAIVLGSQNLRDYLINFARSFIYSTALPPHAIATIARSYAIFPLMKEEREHLKYLISFFQSANISYPKLISNTPIQVVIVEGNSEVKKVATLLQENNLDVRPILYPTVPKGKERLRIVLHSFNTIEKVELLVRLLSNKD